MKRIIIAIVITIAAAGAFAQNRQFGNLTITPYVPIEVGDEHCRELLLTKLLQVTTANDVAQGFDRRFIVVPRINVLSVGETKTFPQKTSLQVMITFYVGDGISSALFKSVQIEQIGVGDNKDKALYSAIRKIKETDPALLLLLEDAKKEIGSYYDKEVSSIIARAKRYMGQKDFESAIIELATVPSFCEQYIAVQNLIQQCGAAILQRNNKEAIILAKTTWSSNPTSQGALEAKKHLASVVITNAEEEKAVNSLIDSIRSRIEVIENTEMEFERAKMESQERIRIEEINASTQTASSFFNTLPNLAYNIIGWFL